MLSLFNQLSTLLITPPGNLIYHLVLVFSIAGALQAALYHWRSSQFPQVRRTMLGLIALLFAQLALFIVGGLSWQGVFNPLTILPPLDRAIALFSLVWIAWLWLFPEPSRPADATNILFSILIFAGLALDIFSWMPLVSTVPYNATLQNIIWQAFSLGFAAFAGVILAIRRPNGWNNGLAFLALIFSGHLLFILFGPKTDHFSGIVRLVSLAAYPLLLTLPQRFPSPTSMRRSSENVKTSRQDTVTRERRRYSTDPKTFHALLALASELDVNKINHAITRAIAQTMLADLCFLIYLTDDKKQMIIASGYDLIREENLEGASLSNSAIPMLANALQRGRPLRLPDSSTSPDMQGLGELLGLETPGHLLSVPILTGPKESIGGVLLLSPYSNRLWGANDQSFLANISSSLVSIIERGKQLATLERRQEENENMLQERMLQIEQLKQREKELSAQLAELQQQQSSGEEEKEKLEALLAVQEETEKTVARLKRENAELREIKTAVNAKDFANKDASHMEQELRSTLEVVARLQNSLAQSNIRILELEKSAAKEDPSEQAEVIASISQELRQPMSSIVGYTDLLLGESVGILGALQRKFVERIKTSIERIGSLIDDIIQITTLEMGLSELKPENVDMNAIIDNAMAYTSNQIREKNISLNLDLPKNIKPIRSDREALQQILIHLLQNAGSATPVDGAVTLRVEMQKEEDLDYILIQVSDTGGGIPADDLPRVFTRLYRAENVLIEGVGDTGVGLSIAKALTEAQHGRIWVDSTPGVGATFSVLLPIAPPETSGG